MIITFIGNDGSGKTTISKEVYGFFKQLGFDVSYKHEYDYVFLRILFRIVGKQIVQKSRNEMLIENKRSFKYILWPFLVWMDLILQYCYFKLTKRNKIILLDRYPYDHLQSFKLLGTLTPITEWLFLHFPKPDVCLLLTVDPNMAYQRKKSTHTYSLEFYIKQTSSYRDLASKLAIQIVDTSGELRKTVRTVIATALKNKKLAKRVIYKGIQNRIIFHSLKEYELADIDLFDKIWKTHHKREAMYVKSITDLSSLLKDSGVTKYSLIKTYVDYSFYGNDVDIILSSSDFGKLLDYTNNNIISQIEKVRFRAKKDAGKADIFIKEGLNIDVHSYVGWENVIFLNFDQLNFSIKTEAMFGVDMQTLDALTNSIIVAVHVFEKGYMTVEEYMFLQRYLDISIFKDKFPELADKLMHFLIELEALLAIRPREFPVFISMKSLIFGYLGILDSMTLRKANKLSITILHQMFWRVRYILKGNLPFDVTY